MTTDRDDPAPGVVELAARLNAVRTATPTVDNRLEAISVSDALGRAAHAQLQSSVAAARAHGISWQSIGSALGTSRQAAFKRFGSDAERLERDTLSEPAAVDLFERTSTVFASLAARNFDAVKALMTFTCTRELPKRKVMGVWDELERVSGPFEFCSDTFARTLDGRNIVEKVLNRHLVGGVVIQTRLHHRDGEWMGRVAYNGAGKITGILFAPSGATDLAF